MTPDDIETVGQIWLAASLIAHDFVEPDFWRSDLQTMTTEILPHARTEGYVHVAFDVIDGFVTLGGDLLACLFVRPDRQGVGIGTALLNHVKTLRPSLSLTVYRPNDAAIGFYESHGFECVAESTCPYTGCPEYVMEWTAPP